ncbi:MAG: RES domain-containing protein [Nitrospirota bacterium]
MLDEVLSIIEQLGGEAKNRLSYARIREIMSAWAKYGVYQIYSIPEELSIHRARRLENKKWFEFADDLGPPAPEKTIAYGRCHKPQHPLCYCSLYEDTALAEVNAEFGEQYVISTFTMPKDIRLIPVGELDYYRRTGRTYIGHETQQSAEPHKKALGEEDGVVAALIDAFLADEFIKQATTQTDYKITSALSDVLLNGDLKPQNR